MRRFLGYGLILGGVVIAVHQMTQYYLFSLVEKGGNVKVTAFFNLVQVWNQGISFGTFNTLPYGQWFLSGLTLGISAYLIWLLLKVRSARLATALGLIIGGALGNVLDRLRHGGVADYLDFHAFGYHWPAFNVTDTAIFIGVILWMIKLPSQKKVLGKH